MLFGDGGGEGDGGRDSIPLMANFIFTFFGRSGTGGISDIGLGQNRESTLPRMVFGAIVETTSLRLLGVGGSTKLVRPEAGDEGATDSAPTGTV